MQSTHSPTSRSSLANVRRNMPLAVFTCTLLVLLL